MSVPPSSAQPGDPGAQSEEIAAVVEPDDTGPDSAGPDGPGDGGPGDGGPAGDDASPIAAQESRTGAFMRDLLSGSWLVTLLAVVLALLIGAVLVVLANPSVQNAASYFFARPSDFFREAWDAIYAAYHAMFRGAIYDPSADSFARQIRPITQTFHQATPLILAGLGLAVGFRAGLFNIGGQGQIILGAIFGAFIGFTFNLPVGLHLFLAAAGAALGGAIWASIAGVLKARTGANEVIVTIMLNNIAIYLVGYLLTLNAFQVPGSNQPLARPVPASAGFPLMFGPQFRLHWGFVLALAAVVFTWWLLERSKLGFQLKAVGANPYAARTAGMSVNRVIVLTMVISGALCGLAGASQVLIARAQFDSDVAASFGFDAITVALLGRSRPVGTLLAALLFGALRSGGVLMQSTTPMPIDLILVIQAIIVLLIAAPPLVRAVFRLPAPGSRARRLVAKEVAA